MYLVTDFAFACKQQNDFILILYKREMSYKSHFIALFDNMWLNIATLKNRNQLHLDNFSLTTIARFVLHLSGVKETEGRLPFYGNGSSRKNLNAPLASW